MARDKIQFSGDAMNLLFPLHVMIDGDGLIDGCGPTIAHIFGTGILGRGFFEVFKVEKPRRINDYAALSKRTGTKLVLMASPDAGAPIQFRSVATTFADSPDRLFLDLSLGVSLADAIKRFDLTGAHFRPNDFSVDLFYTFETQRTLLDDSQRMARALTTAKEDAERKAYLDPVTGIANRRALYGHLESILQGPEDGTEYALLHLDLDKFKLLNDSFGHAAGDRILRHTAMAMQARSGPDDMPARIGGDEFALMLRNVGNDASLMRLAQDLVADISSPVRIDGHSCNVGASVGIIRFCARDLPGADRLLSNSDIALYDAKTGPDSVKMLTLDMVRMHDERATLIAEIEEGIARNQFVPYFQPQIDICTGKIYGLEVLARWENPAQGVLTPDRFLDAAVRANCMAGIDRAVRQQAISSFSTWVRNGARLGKLSLNVTASNLRSPDFVEEVQDELFLAGLSPADVQIELLEAILFDQTDKLLIDRCHALKKAGFSLALDDFGTGHASISTLIDAPISVLKIDRSFVSGIDLNPRMQNITRSILAMAEHIGLTVLAEGVEKDADLAILQSQGCRYFQGYYFSAPLARDEVPVWANLWDTSPGKAALS